MATSPFGPGTIAWTEPETWFPALTRWLGPMLRRGAEGRLRRHDTSGFYDDGSEWLDLLSGELRHGLEEVTETLADALEGARVRTFHGCRTEDAGEYLREGLRIHRREEVTERLRLLVPRNPRYAHALPKLEEMMAECESGIDEGCSFVVLDERAMLRYAAHYLIYGSEWACGVLNSADHGPLLEEGAPTVLTVELPLHLPHHSQRGELATELLQGWCQQATGMRRVPTVDFTFVLKVDLEPALVLDHRHPDSLRDPLNGDRRYRPKRTRCRACEPG